MSNTGFDTLQIKRLKSNYTDTIKNTVLAEGEPLLVLIDINYAPGKTTKAPFFLLGDGNKKIYELIESERIFGNIGDILSLIPEQPSGVPTDINNAAARGSSGQYADADHQHRLTKNVAETALEVNGSLNSFNCRKIRVGTMDATDITGANIGDIYIKYEA